MVKLYRAQPISGISPRTASSFLDQLYGGGKTTSIGGTGLQGQWYTTDPARARNYMPSSFQKFSYFDPKLGPKFMGFGEPMGALDKSKSITTKPGVIKSMNLSLDDFDKVKSFTKKVPTLPGYQFAHNLPNEFLVPKTFLKNRNPSINLGQTLRAYGDRGLAFLKNNALKGLGILGSLPAQAGLMTLAPTMMGNAELPIQKMDQQRAQATSNRDRQNIQKIQQHTGGALSDYRMSRPSSERQYTGHGRSGMGRDPRDRMAMGGLINLYRYGGFI